MSSNKQRPAHEIKLGSIQAAIWRNGISEQTSWFNVSISRVYRDGDVWKTTTAIRRDDLPLLAKAAEMAYAWIWDNDAKNEENTNDAS